MYLYRCNNCEKINKKEGLTHIYHGLSLVDYECSCGSRDIDQGFMSQRDGVEQFKKRRLPRLLEGTDYRFIEE